MDKTAYLQEIETVIAQGPYDASWESLCEHGTPKWYQNDKFGIFIHWGIYAVPAFGNEWYARHVYRKNSAEYKYHLEKYGTLDKFGYKDFIPMFKAEKFDPEEWADLFQEAGAKFVMPVAEHHDGFQMYKSELSPWNAAEMGPCRDVVGELKQAVEQRDMKLCASSHRAEHWWFYNEGRQIDCDVNDPAYAGLYAPAHGVTLSQDNIFDNQPDQDFLEDWLVRTCELVDEYQPKIVFFDWWIQGIAFKPYLKKFAAYYYNRAAQWGVEVAIDAKFDAYAQGAAVRDIERGQLAQINRDFWQNDTSVAKNSWCYTVGNEYKTARSIICDLVDVVSKNGALLLNIGPKADGTIPEEDAGLLREIGAWLKANGEAIYNTHPWKTFGEGPTVVPEGMFSDTTRADFTSEDVRYTARAGVIYATVMSWPEDNKVVLKELALGSKHFCSVASRVEILGYDIAPLAERRAHGYEILAKIDAGDKPVVIKFYTE
ncbi:MAG: alpha-L-fucosidase [Faecalibacterium sp.]